MRVKEQEMLLRHQVPKVVGVAKVLAMKLTLTPDEKRNSTPHHVHLRTLTLRAERP